MFIIQIKLLNKLDKFDKIFEDQNNIKSLNKFDFNKLNYNNSLRKISKQEHQNYIMLLNSFNNIIKKNNITNYFLGGGSLIGAIRTCGMLPYDDDIDIYMQDIELELLFNNFNSSFIKIIKFDGYYKVFYLKNKKIKNYKWSWPFIDIFPYQISKNKIIFQEKKKNININISIIYPLKKHSFDTLCLNIPAESENYLKYYNVNLNKCIIGGYNHRIEDVQKSYTFECSNLKKIGITIVDNYCVYSDDTKYLRYC